MGKLFRKKPKSPKAEIERIQALIAGSTDSVAIEAWQRQIIALQIRWADLQVKAQYARDKKLQANNDRKAKRTLFGAGRERSKL